ncbi:MAG TPA: hypothetical protein PLF84_01420 [Bryobacteraceae bacterium]|nr:hypothetical protein [Bryobacteraceae bacterium]
MAHLVQKVVFLSLTFALMPGAAQLQQPFSHKLHLKQVAGCEPCHTNAAKSTKAEDNLLPFETECVNCHHDIHIKEPRKTTVHQFNHELHQGVNPGPIIAAAIKSKTWLGTAKEMPKAVNTSNACVACHHDIEESDAITEATGKAHYPRMADCLTCHNQINPPESCKTCHDPGTKFRPADHTPEFVDSHAREGAIADKAACQSCHGRKFTCKGCH